MIQFIQVMQTVRLPPFIVNRFFKLFFTFSQKARFYWVKSLNYFSIYFIFVLWNPIILPRFYPLFSLFRRLPISKGFFGSTQIHISGRLACVLLRSEYS